MDVASNAWHVVSSGLTFICGLILAAKLAPRFCVPWRRGTFLYVWHTFFSLAYLYYSLHNPADARTYFRNSLTYEGGFDVASPFVYLLTAVFSRGLGFSYLGAFLVFNIIGFVGLLAVYGAFRAAVTHKSRKVRHLAFLLVLLPSVSFWSAAIGKDALSFMSAGLALWASLNIRGRLGLMLASIAVMFLVRPHIAAIMVCALAAAFILGSRLSVAQRAVLVTLGLGLAAVLVPYALRYAGLEGASGAIDVVDYLEARQEYNLAGGGGVDISSMSLPLQLLTYLLRPWPHEAHSLPALAASLDNVILAGLIVIGGVGALKGQGKGVRANRMFLALYVLACWVILAMTTANLGISVRQKWMFVPALMFLLLSSVGARKPLTEPAAKRPAQ